MDYYSKTIEESSSATDILTNLLALCKGAQQELYVLIDEYDNFSNTILSTVGKDAYLKLTHGPGFFRSFFNALKKKHLIVVDRGKTRITNGNFSKLKEIASKGETSSKITKGFHLEKLMDPENFESLLFYLGLLTIKGPEKDKLRLEIPNETVKRLYYSYIEEAYRDTGIFNLDLSRYYDLRK